MAAQPCGMGHRTEIAVRIGGTKSEGPRLALGQGQQATTQAAFEFERCFAGLY